MFRKCPKCAFFEFKCTVLKFFKGKLGWLPHEEAIPCNLGIANRVQHDELDCDLVF